MTQTFPMNAWYAVAWDADIKRALAASSKDDIKAYRNGKTTFVEATTAKAFAWRAEARAPMF